MNLTIADPPERFGVALSGGGSRAAAFHRGVVQGLLELEWIDRIDVLSTVSGASLFGGAWMAARARKQSDEAFLDAMARELERGFVSRSLGFRALKLSWPGYTRSDLLAAMDRSRRIPRSSDRRRRRAAGHGRPHRQRGSHVRRARR